MKTILLLLLMFFACNSMIGQQVIISFQLDSAAYQSLEGAVHLTEGFTVEDWEEEYPYFKLQESVTILSENGTIELEFVELIPGGLINFVGIQPNGVDEVDLLLAPMAGVLGHRFTGGVDSNDSEIHYLYKDGVSYFEYKNFTFGNPDLIAASPDNLFNFIASVRHEDGQTCFHYGPSQYDPQSKELFKEAIFIIGMGIILENEIDDEEYYLFIQGDPQDPEIFFGEDFTGVEHTDDIPVEGTIYKMSMSLPTFVRPQIKQLDGRLYPNPGRDDINVVIGETGNDQPFEIKVFDQLGRIVISEQSNGGARVNVSRLASGNYLIQVLNEDGVFVTQWSKQ